MPKAIFRWCIFRFLRLKTPSFNARYPDRSTIEIVAPCPWEWVEKWADKPWGKRGDDYDALKEDFSQRLLEKLIRKNASFAWQN
jgi:all-trans-retinol 13,14-reductase